MADSDSDDNAASSVASDASAAALAPALYLRMLNQVLKDLDKFDGPLPEGCVEELREAQQLLNKILDKGESNEPA